MSSGICARVHACVLTHAAAAELKTINRDCGEVMHESSPRLPAELKHLPPSDPSLLVFFFITHSELLVLPEANDATLKVTIILNVT